MAVGRSVPLSRSTHFRSTACRLTGTDSPYLFYVRVDRFSCRNRQGIVVLVEIGIDNAWLRNVLFRWWFSASYEGCVRGTQATIYVRAGSTDIGLLDVRINKHPWRRV